MSCPDATTGAALYRAAWASGSGCVTMLTWPGAHGGRAVRPRATLEPIRASGLQHGQPLSGQPGRSRGAITQEVFYRLSRPREDPLQSLRPCAASSFRLRSES